MFECSFSSEVTTHHNGVVIKSGCGLTCVLFVTPFSKFCVWAWLAMFVNVRFSSESFEQLVSRWKFTMMKVKCYMHAWLRLGWVGSESTSMIWVVLAAGGKPQISIINWRSPMHLSLETNTLGVETNTFDTGREHFSAIDECVENEHLNFSHTHTASYYIAISKQNLRWWDDCLSLCYSWITSKKGRCHTAEDT